MTLIEPLLTPIPGEVNSRTGSASGGAVVIEASNLGRAFRSKMVLRNVDIRVHESEIFGLLGPDGAGKTTLM